MSSEKVLKPWIPKVLKVLVVLFLMWITSGFIFRSCEVRSFEIPVTFKILTVNQNIWKGSFDELFLVGPEGNFQNDAIIVGGLLTFDEEKFLIDLSFQHAELAYFEGQKVIKMKARVDVDNGWSDRTVEVFLEKRIIHRIYIDSTWAQQIFTRY